MLDIDNIIEIAFHANFKTTINLIKTLPQIDTPWFWKEKCFKKYGIYRDLYTGKENYLCHGVKTWCINVNFNDKKVDKYIFEYTPILDRILYNTRKYELIQFNNFLNQFILIIDNDADTYHIFYYETEIEYLNTLNTYKKTNLRYIILTIKNMSPYFINYGPYYKKCKNYVKVIK
jgi:hypothetical protein